MSCKMTFLGFRGTSLLSKVIQKVTGGPYSHVAYVVGSQYSFDRPNMTGPIVVEAWQGWVRMVDCNTSHRADTPYDTFTLSVPNHLAVDFDREIVKHLYKRYDFLAILNFLLKKPLLDDPDKFFCSELLAYVAYYSGVLPLADLAYSVSPTEFIQALECCYPSLEKGCNKTWRRA